MTPPASPFAAMTLADYAACLRRGEVTAEATTAALLARIDALQPRLRAFTFVDHAGALAQAAAVDRLLAAGTDLGPLMGVPVALKDLFSVDGMVTTAGSRLDIADRVAPQGGFVTRLKRGGSIVLGKTATTEFALGGFNLTTPPPWNPCDPDVARMTGGSSHGSAVAMAAGLAGFTVGTDTGGSVRWPAALCGVVGYKATTDHWPQDGVFPLSRHMDSIGVFTTSVADAATIEAALAGEAAVAPVPVASRVLALPGAHFFRHVDDDVRRCFDRAVERLTNAGATIVDVPLPEADEIDEVFGGLVAAEWLAFVGRERFVANEAKMDPVAAARIRSGLDLKADAYVRLNARHEALVASIAARATGIDGWICPTVVTLPAPCRDFRSVDDVAAWNRLNTRNTRPGNLFGQCGISLPMHQLGAPLPAGFQLCAPPHREASLLATALAIESVIGRAPPAPGSRIDTH